MGQYHTLYAVTPEGVEALPSSAFGCSTKLMEQTCSYFSPPGLLPALLYAGPSQRAGVPEWTDSGQRLTGRWAGSRLVVVGDYAEYTDLPLSVADHEKSLMGTHGDVEELGDAIAVASAPWFGFTVDPEPDPELKPWERPGLFSPLEFDVLDANAGLSARVVGPAIHRGPTGPVLVANLDRGEKLDPAGFGQGEDGIADLCRTFQLSVQAAVFALCAISNGRGGGDVADPEGHCARWAGDRIVFVDPDVSEGTFPGAEHLYDLARSFDDITDLALNMGL
jgi:hypothetical protein